MMAHLADETATQAFPGILVSGIIDLAVAILSNTTDTSHVLCKVINYYKQKI